MRYKKFTDKKLKKYVRTNVDKGYSLDNIKKGLIKYGYDPKFTEKLIHGYIIKNHIHRYVAVIALVILFSILLIKPTITGYAILTRYTDHIDNIDLNIDKSSEYVWELENKGEIESIKLNGAIIGKDAKVYIENNNKKYLIYDSKQEITECTFTDLLYALVYFKGNKTRCISHKKLYTNPYFSLREIISRYKQTTNFKGKCIETCSLTDFNKDSYKLIFELKNVELNIKQIQYTIKFSYENHAPNSTTIEDIEWDEDNNYELNLSNYFIDIDGDILRYISTEPENIKININNKTGIAILKPKKDWYGNTQVKFLAIDPGDLTVLSNKITLTVNNINDAPIIEEAKLRSPDNLTRTTAELKAKYIAYDADDDETKAYIRWYKNDKEIIELANKTTITNKNTRKGEEWFFNIKVNDGINWSKEVKSNKLKIGNTAPKIIPIEDKTSNSNEEFIFNAVAVDNDVNDNTDILAWYVNDTILSIDLVTGLIIDLPKESEAGTYSILINVSDGTDYDQTIFNYTIRDTIAPRWS